MITIPDDDGNEIRLPTHKVVCPRCRGEGTHVNPSIDGNGITGEEMRELGDDFREDYINGVYDVPCYECHGENVIDEVDEDQLSLPLLKLWRDHQHDEWEYQQECAMERRMGA